MKGRIICHHIMCYFLDNVHKFICYSFFQFVFEKMSPKHTPNFVFSFSFVRYTTIFSLAAASRFCIGEKAQCTTVHFYLIQEKSTKTYLLD